MSERSVFSLWTLAVAIGWIIATVMAFILVWRLWTSFPR